MSGCVLKMKDITMQFGGVVAVNNLSLEVNEGEIVSLIGPNGAGKSTTMNMLTGYLSSSGGQALINGVDILVDPVRAKKDIGYLPEQLLRR